MKTERGYACDCCGAHLLDDLELDDLSAVLWSRMPDHVCLMCSFGVQPEPEEAA